MDLSQWAAVATIIGVGIGLAGLLLHKSGQTHARIDGLRTELKGDNAGLRGELKDDIAGVAARLDDTRAELKGDIAELRTEVKTDLGKLDRRLTTIEQRTYDLSTRLPPAPAGQSS